MASAWSASDRPLRVLVVDDCPDNRAGLRMLLELWGHQVLDAPDGPAALAAVGDFQPEAVLLDLAMPGMDGYEVARQLCQRLPAGRPLLVAVSGYGEQDDVARAHAAGFDRWLTKPVDVSDLRRLLESCRAEVCA